jgi:hypothetical protein
MQLSFNELEEGLLRFLKEEFLAKGSRPMHMRAPATMHRDVMDKFGLDLPQYREVMARLQHHGIVEAIAIGAPNGHLRIHPVVVEFVRQLDERAQQAKSDNEQPNRMEQTKRYFFAKRWFVLLVIALIILAAVAAAVSNLKTILEWFSSRP